MWQLSRITIFPIKSFDGLQLDSAEVLTTGAIANDRRWALRDAQGAWVNGKASPAMHLLRAQFAADASAVTLSSGEKYPPTTFALPDDAARLEGWLSEYFAKPVWLIEDRSTGFPDDTVSPGPTLVSEQTLAAIGSWFPGSAVGEVRDRFRANLEFTGDAPFCEDRLVADERHVVRFEIGGVGFDGVNPCQRCVVPTRHPQTAEVYPHFARLFAEKRAATLPAWTVRDRFDHFYRLSVNTRLSPVSAGGVIRVGDEVRIGGTVPA